MNAHADAAPQLPRIVVVGGGAGGLELVAELGRRLGRRGRADVVLVDRNASHIWKPLLHEVATGALDSSLDEVGYRDHAYRFGYRYFQGEMRGLDRERREVLLAPIVDEDGEVIMDEQRIHYDVLVMAVGGISNDFGVSGVDEHCIYLDRRSQAERFRQKLLNACVAASLRTQAAADGPAPTVDVAIVGGGATGVELAAELHRSVDELRYYGLESFDQSQLRVALLEAGPRLLPALPERISDAARQELENLGVKVLCNARVVEVTREGMRLAGENQPFIEGDLKVWAAGVKAPDFLADLDGLQTNRANQLVVERTLRTTRDAAVFAIGDCCACPLPDGEGQVPPRAQAAHQMAAQAARNICAHLRGRPLKPYVYKDFGALVNLSRYSTIGSLMGNLVGGSMQVEGRIARFMYVMLYRMHLSSVHGWFRALLMTLVGHINRVVRPRVKLH